MSDARTLLGELVAARRDRSPERAASLLGDDVGYWDCERGEIAGRDAVATALVAADAHIELETVAAGGADAVLELQVEERGRRYRSTEVYTLSGGTVSSIKAYFDPDARG
jgi:hypothetical protein